MTITRHHCVDVNFVSGIKKEDGYPFKDHVPIHLIMIYIKTLCSQVISSCLPVASAQIASPDVNKATILLGVLALSYDIAYLLSLSYVNLSQNVYNDIE